MIKLNLPQEPPELTAQKARLTAEYREKKKAVWSEGAVGETIKRVLCEMTHNKCAYSEAPLETNGSVKHIEHFYPKSIYPERVVEWGNLLPTCATCNAGKGKLDVGKTPIVNPLRDDPKDFLYVEGFRYRACDQKGVGQRTIDVLRLNNLAQFGVPRFKAAQYIVEAIERVLRQADAIADYLLRGEVLQLMEEAGPSHPYSAVIATHLLYEDDGLAKLETLLRERGAWDEHLEAAKQTLLSVAMPAPHRK
jgi:hypothetical protein cdifQCD-6_19393